MKIRILFLAVLALLSAACTRIETGNVGIEATFGQVKPDELAPGVYFTLFKTVHEVSAKEVPVPLYDLRPKSKDNLTMADFDVDVYYRVNPSSAADILVKYAGDLTELKESGDAVVGNNYFLRQAREAAYMVASRIPAADMHTKRTEIAEAVRVTLQEELDRDAGKGMFVVTNVNIRNIVTDPNLEDSIRTAAKTRFEIERKQQEIELARKEADRKRIEAEGDARANYIISQSLTHQLVEVKRIEAMAKFAGAGTHTVVMPANTQSLIQVK